MILIYLDRLALQPLLEHVTQKYSITTDFDEYQSSNADIKIAITDGRFNQPLSILHQTDFINTINKISKISTLVFVVETELHEEWTAFYKCCADNVYWVLPGIINDCPELGKNVLVGLSWPVMVANLYQTLTQTLDTLTPYTVKTKVFDCLLGVPKPHRTFVYNFIKDNSLEDNLILSYDPRSIPNSNNFYADHYFIWEPGTVVNGTAVGTANKATYMGQSTTISQIIPIGVYNQSAYSIVAETDCQNSYSFFTEKIAKPIVARRLFIVFTGYKYLENLRKLGFRTFNGIIDESYDLIEDTSKRFTAALEQVWLLCNRDQTEVLNLIQPIVEHNYNILMTTQWDSNIKKEIANIINGNN